MEQFIWKVLIYGRPSARVINNFTSFTLELVAPNRAAAKAAALAYVAAKGPLLDEYGPYRVAHSQQSGGPIRQSGGPIQNPALGRGHGEVIEFAVSFAQR